MRKEKASVAFQDIENAVTDWGEHLRWTARGWDCIEEYTYDLFARENLGNDLTDYGDKELPDELRQRIARAGQTFRELTYESNHYVWGDVRNQIRYATEHATPNTFAGDLPKPAFNKIEPRRRSRREMAIKGVGCEYYNRT